MTLIANPIYDSVFKFLMEDNRVAKILLSALLKQEVIELEMRRNEYTNLQQTRISLYRIDFAAKIRDASGVERLVLIELQKTWLSTETLRFRQYLGTQYLDKGNMLEEDDSRGYGLPIISIYILGHKLGDLQYPVVYVRRRYLDYDDRLIENGVPDPFIESLTHDSIIVQIPYLKGHARNHLERLLSVFDQDFRTQTDEHLLSVDDAFLEGDERLILNRLAQAAVSPKIRRDMQVEDEILSEIEKRDTDLMLQRLEILKKTQEIEEKAQEIAEKTQEIEEKAQEIAEKKQEIEEKAQEIAEKKQEIEEKKQVIASKDQEIEQSRKEIAQKDQLLRSAVNGFLSRGMSPQEIAVILGLSEEQVNSLLDV